MMSIVPEEELPVENPEEISELEPEHSPETLGQIIGGLIGIVSTIFCCFTIVPGWWFFDLDWPSSTFYFIAGTGGAISGFLLVHKNRFVGLASGLVCELGVIMAIQLLLLNVNMTINWVVYIVGIIGALPGYGLYCLLTNIQESISGPDETQTDIFGDGK